MAEKSSKYLDIDTIYTTDGFEYDVFLGGYIRPELIMSDEDRVKQLQEAIQLIDDWKQELIDDEMLEEL